MGRSVKYTSASFFPQTTSLSIITQDTQRLTMSQPDYLKQASDHLGVPVIPHEAHEALPQEKKPKQLGRQAKVWAGIDIGGKYTKACVRTKDGREAFVSVPTYQHAQEDLDARLQGLSGSTLAALSQAAKNAQVSLDEIDSVVFGAPGARNARDGSFRMPNAIGSLRPREPVPWVDFEGSLKAKLLGAGFRSDAQVRGFNDCDIAAGAKELGEAITINKGEGEFGKLTGQEKSFFVLLGTGIGIGWANERGIDEGAHGAMEGGHATVVNPFAGTKFECEFACTCGNCDPKRICIETVASTTGQERVMRILVEKAFEDKTNMDNDQMRHLLDETQRWNHKKLDSEGGSLSVGERERLNASIAALGILINEIGAPFGSQNIKSQTDKVVFDSCVIDKCACANLESPDHVALAHDAMRICGESFGEFLNSLIKTANPKQVVIGGGGALTFRRLKRDNPFWEAMSRVLAEHDGMGSAKKTWIKAVVDKDVNLGINGSMRYAKEAYEQGQAV
jgi:predicted NBD/HSP70 family sugar kinase